MESMKRDVREVVREEPAMHRLIQSKLAAGPLTVPELAEAVGHPAHEVLIWVMGMRRYGYLRELPGANDEGFFRYESLAKEASR